MKENRPNGDKCKKYKKKRMKITTTIANKSII